MRVLRARRLAADERGSVTAEFAVVLPAVVLLIALAAATLSAAGRQVALEQAAGQAARLAARGESAARVREVARQLAPVASLSVSRDGELVCITVSAPAAVPLPLPPLRAEGCALAGVV